MNLRKIAYFLLILPLLFAACREQKVEFTPKGEALTDFSLQAPNNNVSLRLNAGTPNRTVQVSWLPSRPGLGSPVVYHWVVQRAGGDLASPAVRIQADREGLDTRLTLTQRQLDEALRGLNIAEGATAELIWSVTADNGTQVRQAVDVYNISVTRFGEGISDFNLTAPSDEVALILNENTPNAAVAIEWSAATSVRGGQVTYRWLAIREGGNFNEPALSIPADNNGQATRLTLTQQTIDEALAGLGVDRAGVAGLIWTVEASVGNFTHRAQQQFRIAITRFGSGKPLTFRIRNAPANTPANLDVFLAGEFGNLGVAPSNWQQPGTNPALKMNRNSDGTYELTVLVPVGNVGTSFNYKYFLATTASPNWGNGEQRFGPDGCTGDGTDRSYTFRGDNDETVNNSVSTWEGFCPTTPISRFVVTIPAFTPSDKDVFIAGDLRGFTTWPQPGTDERLKMRRVQGTNNQFELFLPITLNQEFEYKYFLATTSNPTWGHGEQQANATNTDCEGAPNRRFTFNGTNSTNDQVVTWEGYCSIGVGRLVTFRLDAVPGNTPGNLDVFLAGEFGDLGVAPSNWQQPGTNPALRMNRNADGSYSLSVLVGLDKAGRSFQYKYFLATTAAPNWGNGEQRFGAEGCVGIDNRTLTFSGDEMTMSDEVIVWEGFCPNVPLARIRATVPANTPAGFDVYLAGSLGFVTWPQPGTDDRLKMIKTGDRTYEIWLPLPVGQEVEYKYFLARKSAPNWGNGEQQRNANNDCEGAPNRRFTFNGTNGAGPEDTVIVWEGFCQ